MRDADFLATGGIVTFPAKSANGATRTVQVTVHNDAHDEPDVTFAIPIVSVLGGAAGATVTTTITILDDDPTPSLTVADVAAQYEGHSGTTRLSSPSACRPPAGRWCTASALPPYGHTLAVLMLRGSTVVGVYALVLFVTGFFTPGEFRVLQDIRAGHSRRFANGTPKWVCFSTTKATAPGPRCTWAAPTASEVCNG